MKRYATLDELRAQLGLEMGTSDWLRIDQARIDAFAHATGDLQWIHVDAARAAAGPFGATIAHGFLTLSLIPMLAQQAYAVDAARMGINYGLNRVRFISPVRVGSQLRGHFKLLEIEPIEGGVQLVTEATLELGGSDRPACVAHSVSRLFT